MNKPKFCPCCSKTNPIILGDGVFSKVYCSKCGLQTKDHKTQEEAVDAWNLRANEEPELKFDFQKLYMMYPRKKGKKHGIQRCISQIKTQKKYDLLKKAIENYSRESFGKNKNYVLYFSSFMNQWEDYLEVEPDKEDIFTRDMRALFELENS